MKIELEPSDIERIVKSLIVELKPLINNSHNSGDDELMDVKGLAKYLKVKESWVYEKIHTKQIPFQKAGRLLRFRKKHIDKWLDNPYAFTSRAYRPLEKEGGNK
ncbi:MAG TPA: helix-turn-helix domain-containing protein [Candidatus Scalindua sp.]|jgi:excisionase family DNA binding protein|nr:helix-turn-helix domain-containing protein [Candidatus Scalindua sp.]